MDKILTSGEKSKYYDLLRPTFLHEKATSFSLFKFFLRRILLWACVGFTVDDKCDLSCGHRASVRPHCVALKLYSNYCIVVRLFYSFAVLFNVDFGQVMICSYEKLSTGKSDVAQYHSSVSLEQHQYKTDLSSLWWEKDAETLLLTSEDLRDFRLVCSFAPHQSQQFLDFYLRQRFRFCRKPTRRCFERARRAQTSFHKTA